MGCRTPVTAKTEVVLLACPIMGDTVLTILEKVDTLRRIELLREIRTESLARIASISKEICPASQETLYVANQVTERVYVIVEGEVVLQRDGSAKQRLGCGEILGILPALAEGVYRETATAEASARLLQIEQHELLDLIASDFHITRGVIKGLVRLLGEGP